MSVTTIAFAAFIASRHPHSIKSRTRELLSSCRSKVGILAPHYGTIEASVALHTVIKYRRGYYLKSTVLSRTAWTDLARLYVCAHSSTTSRRWRFRTPSRPLNSVLSMQVNGPLLILFAHAQRIFNSQSSRQSASYCLSLIEPIVLLKYIRVGIARSSLVVFVPTQY